MAHADLVVIHENNREVMQGEGGFNGVKCWQWHWSCRWAGLRWSSRDSGTRTTNQAWSVEEAFNPHGFVLVAVLSPLALHGGGGPSAPGLDNARAGPMLL
jgi:hypothetical protein